MNFHYTVKSKREIKDLLKAIEEALTEIQFSIQWQTNLTESIKKKGLDKVEAAYHILEVCNPFVAEKILSQNPEAHYFLPCKMTVHEKDGEVYVGLLRPTHLMQPLKDEKLNEIVKEAEKQLIQVIDQVK